MRDETAEPLKLATPEQRERYAAWLLKIAGRSKSGVAERLRAGADAVMHDSFYGAGFGR